MRLSLPTFRMVKSAAAAKHTIVKAKSHSCIQAPTTAKTISTTETGHSTLSRIDIRICSPGSCGGTVAATS